MNSIDATRKEKDILLNLAIKFANGRENDTINSEIGHTNSYYRQVSRNPDEYMHAHAFNTIADLRTQLMEFWKHEEIMYEFIPVVLASTFKKRPTVDEDRKATFTYKDGGGDEILPTYTYTM